MQALLKIGLTIRTQGQCAEGGGMLSAPGGAVTAQIAQNSRSGRDPCSDPTKTAAKSKSPRLRLWRARPDAWERWVARPSSVPALEIFKNCFLFLCVVEYWPLSKAKYPDLHGYFGQTDDILNFHWYVVKFSLSQKFDLNSLLITSTYK